MTGVEFGIKSRQHPGFRAISYFENVSRLGEFSVFVSVPSVLIENETSRTVLSYYPTVAGRQKL